ncbi:hypothetical protein C8034_v000211 [Colletotrichum sidae]|uniref:F-box domain-containing protein n=1 Tax=Colletotrichum sidae TaxID=1347389 RepID=A0A4R8TPJ8_9PEZI|nr:hypothetical protein C8034_v000211 [Colletotrichum sidae]
MFDQLSDDIVLEIISQLRTARDVARLALSSRHLHSLIHNEGWRTFVRTCFPLHVLPLGTNPKWNELAETLTRQTRAWDTKAFQPIAYTDERRQGGNFFTGYHNTARPFQPVIDARLTFDKTWEVVSWGAGEDVVGRFRTLNSRGESDAWFRMEGKAKGYRAGGGDVTAIHLTEPNGKLGLLTGRANGDLSLVSASPGSAGQTLSSFKIPKPVGTLEATSWTSIGSIDTLPNRTSVIAGNRATVSLFPLDLDATGEAAPLDSQSFGTPGLDRTQYLHAVKAMSNDTIACAIGGDRDPIRYLTISPAGFTPNNASKNPGLLASCRIDVNKKSTVRAIQPVKPGPFGHTNLLLSAWDDGTCRLTDLRTPSPYDVLYRDMYQPFEAVSSLITYGSDRFVAGSAETEALKIFDFRWSKSYYHSSALPCWNGTPFPDPIRETSSRSLSLANVKCDHFRREPCVWHRLSREDHYRPNSRLHIMQFKGAPRASNSGIFSLAKASDVSDSFYVGLAGAVAEFSTAGGDNQDGVPSAAVTAAEKRGLKASPSLFSFAETGDGKLSPGISMSIYMPRLIQRFGTEIDGPQYGGWYKRQTPKNAVWHRWDSGFWRPTHFTF